MFGIKRIWLVTTLKANGHKIHNFPFVHEESAQDCAKYIREKNPYLEVYVEQLEIYSGFIRNS